MAALMQFQEQSIESEIITLLHDLPHDSKLTVKQFVRFLYEQKPKLPSSSLEFKVVTVPASHLSGLVGLLDPGYEGDALRDTEACFDDL